MKNSGVHFKRIFALALASAGMFALSALPGRFLVLPLRISSLLTNNPFAAITTPANLPQIFSCPPDIAVNTNSQFDPGAIVTYSTPPGTICTPPSGSFFQAGTTTVTCCPTRPSVGCDPLLGPGCSFRVTVFNICLQQDITSSRPGVSFLRFSTGIFGMTNYQYVDCSGPFGPTVINGQGKVTKSGSGVLGTTITLNDPFKAFAIVRARLLTPGFLGSGSATITPPGGAGRTITDSQIANSKCVCPLTFP